MGDPAVILCRYCAQRCLGASTVEGIRFKSRLPHGFCGGDFPGPPSGNHLLEVVRQGHRLAAGVLALCLSNCDAFALTLQDVLALQFCNSREYGEHELAGWRGRVDGLLAAYKFHLLFGQPLHKVEQVARISCETTDRLDKSRYHRARRSSSCESVPGGRRSCRWPCR